MSQEDFDFKVIDNVFVVVWKNVSTAAAKKITEQVRVAHADRGDLVYVALVPDGTPPPDDDGRAALSGAVKVLLPYCSSMHCVIEGSGFRKSVIRGAATGIFMLSGQRGKMKVHDTFTEALRAAPAVQVSSIPSLIDRAQGVGVTR